MGCCHSKKKKEDASLRVDDGSTPMTGQKNTSKYPEETNSTQFSGEDNLRKTTQRTDRSVIGKTTKTEPGHRSVRKAAKEKAAPVKKKSSIIEKTATDDNIKSAKKSKAEVKAENPAPKSAPSSTKKEEPFRKDKEAFPEDTHTTQISEVDNI